MAIFNEAYVEFLLEKKTTEEYHEDVFKKEFNFVPDKNSNGRSGTIESEGKKYHVTLDAKETGAVISGDGSEISEIKLSKGFFRMKGSNQNERMKAVLQHEIGHQNLHNKNPENKTVDPKNKTEDIWKDWYSKTSKHLSGKDISDDKEIQRQIDKLYSKPNGPKPPVSLVRDAIYKSGGLNEYLKTTGTKQEQKERNADYQLAKKYELKENKDEHNDAREIEADRFTANRTSEKALKKGIREVNKQKKKSFDCDFDNSVKKDSSIPYTEKDKKKARAADNNMRKDDYDTRSKALKDDDLRKAKTYK